MAGEVHGSKAEFKVQNQAGTITAIGGGSSQSLDESIDTAEISKFLDTAKNYIAGLSDGTVSWDGNWNPTDVTLFRGIKQMVRTFEFYPAGNSTGNEKIAGSLIMTQLTRNSDIGDKVGMSVSFQLTGALTTTTI